MQKTVDFSRYIKELLYYNDCVILPGFGAFISKYKPAEIDAQSNSFIPPSKEIVFNNQLIHNDGLLINYICIANNLSYPDAKLKVSDYINSLYSQLFQFDSVEVSELGKFTLDAKCNVLFEPQLSSNYLPDSFGLSSFSFQQFEVHAEISDAPEAVVKVPGKLRSLFSNSYFKAAIIAVPVIVAFLFLSIRTDFISSLREKYLAVNAMINDTIEDFKKFSSQDIYDNPLSMEASILRMTNKRNALYYEEPSSGKKKIPDSESKMHENQIDSTKNISDDSSEETPKAIIDSEKENIKDVVADNIKKINAKPEVKEVQTKGIYHLIAGSFSNKGNADAFENKLGNMGYNTGIIRQKNGLYSVSVNSYNDRNIAESELYKINSSKKDFTVWILTSK